MTWSFKADKSLSKSVPEHFVFAKWNQVPRNMIPRTIEYFWESMGSWINFPKCFVFGKWNNLPHIIILWGNCGCEKNLQIKQKAALLNVASNKKPFTRLIYDETPPKAILLTFNWFYINVWTNTAQNLFRKVKRAQKLSIVNFQLYFQLSKVF